MTYFTDLNADNGLNPLTWAQIGLNASSPDQARAELVRQLEQVVHINSLHLIVGADLPASYRPGQRCATETATRDQVSGTLVSKEWTRFQQDGHFVNDPMVRRVGMTSRPMFWFEDSEFHRSMNDEELRFARNYFEYDIRCGVVDGTLDMLARKVDFIGLDSRISPKEFREFERYASQKFKLAISWFSEGVRLREMKMTETQSNLTRREQECLQWTATGQNTSQISDRLFLCEATVNEHIASAMRRLRAQTRVQACARAVLSNQISL